MSEPGLQYRAAVIFGLQRFVDATNDLSLKAIADDWIVDVYVPKFNSASLVTGTFSQLLEEFRRSFEQSELLALEWFHQCVLKFRSGVFPPRRIRREAGRLLDTLR